MTADTPRAVPAKRGYTVFYEGRALLSTGDPAAACERLVAALPKTDRTLYLCVSPLFGYGLEGLLDTMHPSSAVLCVETEPALAGFTRRYLPPGLTKHPRFALVTGPADGNPAAVLAAVFARWGHRVFRRVVRFDLSSAVLPSARRRNLVLNIEGTLRHEIALEWENAATLMKLGRRYTLNFLRNLRLLGTAPSVEAFRFLPEERGGYKGEGSPGTVHVLGAGPSLDGFFAEYSGGAVGGAVVCVDTALPVLRSHGLGAGLVVALEAQHWNLRDFIGCRDTARALAMDMSALPATAGCLNGPTYLFFTPWTPLRIFDRLKERGLLPLEMPPLSNVGITAYALARRLFSGEIVPHGLDFTFTIDQYHCRGSPGHIDRLRKLDRFHSLFPIEAALRPSASAALAADGSREEPVRQDPVMRRYRELFLAVRRNGNGIFAAGTPPSRAGTKTAVTGFIRATRFELTRIRNILGGREKAGGEELADLLNRNDFLFAHYPDYAETRNPADTGDISFLKRIRAEIDAFIQALPDA